MISTNAKILENTYLKNDIYKIVLQINDMPNIKCGQFVMISCGKEDGILLKRPISIYSLEKDTITLLYQIIGKGTKALSEFKAGECTDIIMPLGNGFEIEDYKKIALIGGGLGIFPLYSIIKENPDREYYAYLGCSDKDNFVCLDEFQKSCKEIYIATDDGSLGCKGFVTDLIKKDLSSFDVVFACGPKPMLNTLKDLIKDTQIPCYASLEERMGCGFGACLTCAIRTIYGTKRVCKDGPVFDLKEVIL